MALANKLALVTGASQGIGLSIAKKFAASGADLVLADFSPTITNVASELANTGVKVTSHVCDVTSSEQINAMFEKIKKDSTNGVVPNVIVNSAGITRDNLLLRMSEEEWDQVMATNLKGTFLVTQAASRLLIEMASECESYETAKTYASIINLASVIGKFGNVGQANYAASKAGVEAFSKSTAKELGRFKIRCNSILPGFINTPMTDAIPEKFVKMMLKMIPLARIGEPEEIADLAEFLASDESSYITGASIECSGGIGF
jgi:NAD(P)-dependent dehydrogenase (short-subunit alcohol dehydrogenase family)